MLEVDLFAEDQAHELIAGALVRRVLKDENVAASLTVRSAVGGHGRALAELRTYQRSVIRGHFGLTRPDLVAVTIDANCRGPVEARREVDAVVDAAAAVDAVIACPDPHVERWMFADPQAFAQVVGLGHPPGRRKCARDHYKSMLRGAIARAGHLPTLGGLEFANDVVAAMDLHRASVNEPSLGALVERVRAVARRRAAAA